MIKRHKQCFFKSKNQQVDKVFKRSQVSNIQIQNMQYIFSQINIQQYNYIQTQSIIMEKGLTESPELIQNDQTELKEVGSWNKPQNLRYAVFLYKNKKLFSRKKRSNQIFFQQMAKYVKTRSSIQCRCHHQKVFQKFKSLQKIISYYKRMFRLQNQEAFNEQILSMVQNKPQNLEIQRIQTKKESQKQAISLSDNISFQIRQAEPFNIDNTYYQYQLMEIPNPYIWMCYWNNFFSYGLSASLN